MSDFILCHLYAYYTIIMSSYPMWCFIYSYEDILAIEVIMKPGNSYVIELNRGEHLETSLFSVKKGNYNQNILKNNIVTLVFLIYILLLT